MSLDNKPVMGSHVVQSTREIVNMTVVDENQNNRHKNRYIIVFILYLLYIILSAVIFSLLEDITFIDGLYFIIVTQSTIGYGDIKPTTTGGYIFTFFFVIISFACVVVIFNLLFDYWFDSKIEQLCQEIHVEINHYANAVPVQAVLGANEKERQKRLYFFIYLTLYLLWIVIWVVFFATNPNEDMTFFGALYFAIITSSTVGYGHFKPKSEGGKLFAFFFISLGVIALGVVLSAVSDKVVEFINKCSPSIAKDIVHKEEVQKNKLKDILSEYSVMTKHQFILHKLLKKNKITRSDYDGIEKEFDSLDKDGNGILNTKDLDWFDNKNATNNQKSNTLEVVSEDSNEIP